MARESWGSPEETAGRQARLQREAGTQVPQPARGATRNTPSHCPCRWHLVKTPSCDPRTDKQATPASSSENLLSEETTQAQQ